MSASNVMQQQCYFLESSVENKPEITDDDLKSENNESDDSNNDSSKQTTPKEAQQRLASEILCNECNCLITFQAT